jgi:hypothetical protein
MQLSYAGNGNGNGTPTCNCGSADEVNIFAAGTAVRVGPRQIRCDGSEGTCWEINITPDGWSLTVYVQPPITFANSTAGGNTLNAPVEVSRTEYSKTYQWGNEWKQIK